jgi:regulatory protein
VKVTAISAQVRNPNRVNISVDGKYLFSLDVFQVVDLGIKVGAQYSESDLKLFSEESEFGKLYGRALEYCMSRPHSAKEVRDYLYRKTLKQRYKSRKNGEIKEREGVSKAIVDRVFERLVDKKYVDDVNFARYWVENRNQRKGSSVKKLRYELMSKGVASDIIDSEMSGGARSDSDEILKIIAKKRSKYDDDKMTAYLARQGFSYDLIKNSIAEYHD